MPIYAYRCTACGHAQDVLQKLSDPLLTDCPSCGAATFAKQLTAAGFQLKGSGWYVTDFRDGGTKAAKKDDKTGDDKAAGDKPAADQAAESKATESKATEAGPAGKGAEKVAVKPAAPAAAAPAPPPAAA
jgi:putative FmdB family regulatory protein